MTKQTQSQNVGGVLAWGGDDNTQKKPAPRQAWGDERPAQANLSKYPPPKYPGQNSLAGSMD